jgi:hypothetical protein
VLDQDLNLVKLMPAVARDGQELARLRVYDAAPRRSFVVALKDVPELWEVSYDPKAPEVATGLVHDFRSREGTFVPGFLNARRTPLDETLDDFSSRPTTRR